MSSLPDPRFSSSLEKEEPIGLEDHGPVLGSGCWPFGSLVLLGLGIFIAVQMWSGTSAQSLDSIRVVALSIVGVCALPLIIVIIQVVRLKRALGTARLLVDLEDLPLGYRLDAFYVRPLRGATVEKVEARLQCQEVVEKGSRKKKTRKTAIVHDEPIEVTITRVRADELRLRVPVRIRREGPPSVDFSGHKIEWWVRLRLETRGCPNTRSSFRLHVLPAFMESEP